MIRWFLDIDGLPPRGLIFDGAFLSTDEERMLLVQLDQLELPPRSAYVLAGEARTRWQHLVSPTKALRYSITFRTLTPGASPAGAD